MSSDFSWLLTLIQQSSGLVTISHCFRRRHTAFINWCCLPLKASIDGGAATSVTVSSAWSREQRRQKIEKLSHQRQHWWLGIQMTFTWINTWWRPIDFACTWICISPSRINHSNWFMSIAVACENIKTGKFDCRMWGIHYDGSIDLATCFWMNWWTIYSVEETVWDGHYIPQLTDDWRCHLFVSPFTASREHLPLVTCAK